jgi:hypothetical protein
MVNVESKGYNAVKKLIAEQEDESSALGFFVSQFRAGSYRVREEAEIERVSMRMKEKGVCGLVVEEDGVYQAVQEVRQRRDIKDESA